MKAKVIMLETTDKSSIIGRYIDTGKIIINNTNKDIPRGIPQHIYLIDESAEIQEGDYCIDVDMVFGSYEKEDVLINYKGIIVASTDLSLNLPLLSKQSIKLLVDYYNQFGKMPEFVETTV